VRRVLSVVTGMLAESKVDVGARSRAVSAVADLAPRGWTFGMRIGHATRERTAITTNY
jgi:hypothetical protein